MNIFRHVLEAPRTRLAIPLVVPPGVPLFSSSYVAFARPPVIPATEGMPCPASGPESRGRLGGANNTGLKVKWQIVVRSVMRSQPC